MALPYQSPASAQSSMGQGIAPNMSGYKPHPVKGALDFLRELLAMPFGGPRQPAQSMDQSTRQNLGPVQQLLEKNKPGAMLMVPERQQTMNQNPMLVKYGMGAGSVTAPNYMQPQVQQPAIPMAPIKPPKSPIVIPKAAT